MTFSIPKEVLSFRDAALADLLERAERVAVGDEVFLDRHQLPLPSPNPLEKTARATWYTVVEVIHRRPDEYKFDIATPHGVVHEVPYIYFSKARVSVREGILVA
jgi:hypothetical protein